jgi:hypothetical protein
MTLPAAHYVPSFEITDVSGQFTCVRNFISPDYMDSCPACMDFAAKFKDPLKLGYLETPG